MVVRVATPCLQWSPPAVPHSPTMHQTLASTITSPELRRTGNDGALVSIYRPSLPSRLNRSHSCEFPKPRFHTTLRRTCSASMDSAFSDEDFSKRKLALRFQSSVDDSSDYPGNEPEFFIHTSEERDEISAEVERRANGLETPSSLSMIAMTNQWQEGFREAGESAYCSVKKAFSSMVFIIRELHGFTLHMRELLYYEDLQEIWVRVQKEMHASFVWLFQQVFSQTPTLMVYVMILLANFTVHSMSSNAAIACTAPTPSIMAIEGKDERIQRYEPSAIKSSVTSSSGKTASIGGISGGGGKARPSANGTEGEGWFDQSGNLHRTIVPGDGVSQVSPISRETEAVNGQNEMADEVRLWNSIVDEASRMQAEVRDEALDGETVGRFVSPVTAKVEEKGDDYADYLKTEMMYQLGLAQEPNNTLLLANYAQFLFVVLHDYVRAEDYFKRAVEVEPKDAEAFNKYANFLWQVKKDLWAAEQTFLEAISAEPDNSFYAANYAHFLWNTGGEDTCFPLDSPDGPAEC
ncbi:hypothetical protein Dimus_020185 [Dionaea muscipula]